MTPAELLDFATSLAGFNAVPADSCVVHDTGRPLTRLLASINATTGDLALAKSLGCDGYLLHHPLAGAARRNFSQVLDRMLELLEDEGVPTVHAENAITDLRRRLRHADHAADWDHLASAAELLDISLVNVHLPADELGRLLMVEALRDLPIEATVSDAVERLRAIPELAHQDNEIVVVPDEPGVEAGRVAVMHGGGTNGGATVASALFDHSAPHGGNPVRTVVYIHLMGDDAKRLQSRAEEGGSGTVIVTGHLASDAIGMNRLIDALHADHAIEVIRHGGLRPFTPVRADT